jgi:hypothetical protein
MQIRARVARFGGPPPYRPFDATVCSYRTNVPVREGAGGEPRQDPRHYETENAILFQTELSGTVLRMI